MKNKLNFLFSLLLIFLIGIPVAGQETTNEKPRVYIEGSTGDFNFIRNNIQFVDFVNDPNNSDLHIIVSSQTTGSGGRNYTLAFYSETLEQIGEFTLSCSIAGGSTEDESRQKLMETLRIGLLPFANEFKSDITVSVQQPNYQVDRQTEVVVDPWKNWVFDLGVSGSLSGEELRKNYSYRGNVRIRKITEEWKINANYSYNRSETKITRVRDDVEEIISSMRLTQSAGINWVKSLTDHWSMGLNTYFNKSSYSNIDIETGVNASLEYNFYTWDQSDRRTFTASYHIGPEYSKYFETTILGKDQELLWKHDFRLNLDRTEQWGDIRAWVYFGNYFHDFSTNYFRTGFRLSRRIAKGLFFDINMEVESIHNQIYLPESQISDEDLFLGTRRLPSSFGYSGGIGFSYKFGSIYNNVVNERL